MQITSPLSGFLQEALVKKVQKEAQLELGFSNNGYLPPYKAPEKVKPLSAGVYNLVRQMLP